MIQLSLFVASAGTSLLERICANSIATALLLALFVLSMLLREIRLRGLGQFAA